MVRFLVKFSSLIASLHSYLIKILINLKLGLCLTCLHTAALSNDVISATTPACSVGANQIFRTSEIL